MLASDFAGPIEEAFEVGETAQYVLDGKYERVALQFPDELVPHATAVHAALGRLLPSSVSLYVLADCTFDGSQLDYVAAQHVDAQLLVHYGGAQLDVSGPIASRLVFPHRRADARALADALADALEPAGGEAARLALLDTAEHLLVIYQLGYAHAMPALDAAMRARAPGRVTVATVARDFGSASAECAAEEAADGAAAGSGEVLVIEGFRAQLPAGLALSGCALVYVGEEDAPLDAIVLAHCAARTVAPRATPAAGDGAAGDGPSAGAAEGATTTLPELPVLLLDPAAAPPSVRRLLLSSARRLMRRYYLVQRARDVTTFGLVVATLSANHFRPVLDGLKAALRAAGRRWYVLLVGKLNPAKLANFPDIGMFVLLGGARAAVVDSKDFLAPIITPYELLLALTKADGEWSGEYVLDYGRLLPRLASAASDAAAAAAAAGQAVDDDGDGDGGGGPRMSLLTGSMQRADLRDAAGGGDATADAGARAAASGTVTIAYERTVATFDARAGGAAYLLARQFQGLDSTPGTHKVQEGIARGRAGVASGFAGEGAGMARPAPELSELLQAANSLNDMADAVGGED